MSERKFLGYPNPLASEAEKATKEYGLSYFKSMYRDWAGENDVLLESRRSRWQTARNYAGGKQSTAKYKDLMNVNGDQSYANLDWSVVPIIPKFVDIIVNSLTNADYHIKATAIDPVSTSKRLEDEMKIKTRMLTKDFLKEVEMLTGIPAQGINDYTPQSKEELELFMQLTYKQAAEIAIEQGLKLAMTINDWREVAKRVIRDLVVIGIGAVKTELDDRGVMIRYVDPLYLVTSYSENPDFTKITHAGEIRRISVRELKAEAGDQFTEKEYADIATRFAGKWGNAKQFRTVPNIVNGQEYYEYDHFLIDVMDGQFIVPNKLVYEEKENKYGGKTVNKKKENYKLPQKSKYNRSLMKVSYDCKYTGKMILGSDYLFDYGKAINQVRPKSALHKTKLDYIIYAPDIDFMKNQSLCERMIPFGDQIQLVHLKLQQLAAKARPKGLAMEVGSMEGVSDGKGGTFSTLDIQDIYEQTGNYYFRYINDDGSPSQARPITELQGGMGGALQELLVLYDHNLARLRDVSGINEARDGNLPSKESVVGVAKLNLIASNNATRAINDAYLNIYRRTAESAILMIQDLVEYDRPYKGYVHAIGELNMTAIEVTKDVSLYEFGIILEAEPNEEDKAKLEENIQQSLAQKELRIEDAIMIRSVKNMKLANQLLILRRNRYIEQQMQQAQAQAQANAEQQAMAAQQKFEGDMKREQAMNQFKLEFLQNEMGLKDQFAQKEHMRKLEEIKLMNDGKIDVAQVNNEQKS
jgi:hypothetical protein